MSLRFHHPPATTRFWRTLAAQALQAGHPTPCYIFSVEPLKAALRELDTAFGHLPIKHWLSCKTQPLRPQLQWWRRLGRPIEVVSEFEFRAALHEGFAADHILVNGPAKHHWLPSCAVAGLWVNFDSLNELKALAPLAKKLKWHVGLRLRTSEEYDPEAPEFPTQFGLRAGELTAALKLLKQHQLPLEVLHFHLRTNVPRAAIYRRALTEVRDICTQHSLAPRYLDCGGGFPPEHVLGFDGQPVAQDFRLRDMANLYAEALSWFPSCTEIWLENGRWFSARSGALIVTVLDEKRTPSLRHLICDGGRTMNTLISNWEAHELLSLPERKGRKIMTTVNGPTCMAWDKLARRPLPASIRVGDRLLWLEAGAYHLPWETRFSHGLGTILWHDGHKLTQVRAPEQFKQWWPV
jgi:diaminopimelate decarboxylase